MYACTWITLVSTTSYCWNPNCAVVESNNVNWFVKKDTSSFHKIWLYPAYCTPINYDNRKSQSEPYKTWLLFDEKVKLSTQLKQCLHRSPIHNNTCFTTLLHYAIIQSERMDGRRHCWASMWSFTWDVAVPPYPHNCNFLGAADRIAVCVASQRYWPWL